MSDFMNKNLIEFEITGKINRKEYGLKWSSLTEAGGMVVAEDVKLEMNVEVIKQ